MAVRDGRNSVRVAACVWRASWAASVAIRFWRLCCRAICRHWAMVSVSDARTVALAREQIVATESINSMRNWFVAFMIG